MGVTYTTAQKDANGKPVQEFAALVVYNGRDNRSSLQQLGQLRFTCASFAYNGLWAALQSLIDANTRPIYLNGDWPFINSLLGLMAPSSNHPCPICKVLRQSLLTHAESREKVVAGSRTFSQEFDPLLTLPSSHIVPTPLHVFLGLCNKLIKDVFPAKLGKNTVKDAISLVKTTHATSSPGLAAVHDLNGVELSNLCKHGIAYNLADACDDKDTSVAVEKLAGWMEKLHEHLLHKDDWSAEKRASFATLVDELHRDWKSATGTNPTPKVHMLGHSIDFALKHGAVGRYSEARIESHHAQFNRKQCHTHNNQGKNMSGKLRRSLADLTLQALQPALLEQQSAVNTT